MIWSFRDQKKSASSIIKINNGVVKTTAPSKAPTTCSLSPPPKFPPPVFSPTAPAVIICHNHPSGDPTPSPEDIAVTQQLVAAGQHLDIELVDHLVIGNQRFVSLKERLRW